MEGSRVRGCHHDPKIVRARTAREGQLRLPIVPGGLWRANSRQPREKEIARRAHPWRGRKTALSRSRPAPALPPKVEAESPFVLIGGEFQPPPLMTEGKLNVGDAIDIRGADAHRRRRSRCRDGGCVAECGKRRSDVCDAGAIHRARRPATVLAPGAATSWRAGEPKSRVELIGTTQPASTKWNASKSKPDC